MDKQLKRLGSIAATLYIVCSAPEVLAASLEVAQGDTLTVNNGTQLTVTSAGSMWGTLNNYGRIDLEPTGNSYIGGSVYNHGFIDISKSAFSILGGDSDGSDRKIINYADGTIMMNGYVDMYSPQSWLENAGRFIVTRLSKYGLTAGLMRGTIKNTGFMQLEGVTGKNICRNYGILTFRNEGFLEVVNQSICDFGSVPERDDVKTTFIQNTGETRVNGTLGAHQITINQGMVSGTGTVKGNFGDWPLYDAVTLAPGTPYGTLTFSPAEGYLMCVGCAIDIELAGSTSSDHVHVNGEFDMNDWKLNVMLRNGYIPAPGTQFTVVSANSIYYYGPEPTLNLPELPNGRSWNVQNTGTEVILTAN